MGTTVERVRGGGGHAGAELFWNAGLQVARSTWRSASPVGPAPVREELTAASLCR